MWLLTYEANDYNQHGDYHGGLWKQKPTSEELIQLYAFRSAMQWQVDEVLKGEYTTIGIMTYKLEEVV